MTSSDDLLYMFKVKYPEDPNDEKQWCSFLDQVRNHPVSDYSKNKCISLYYHNDVDTYAFIMLLDGNQLGKAMAAQISKHNFKCLPIENDIYPTKDQPKWVLFEQDFMVGKKECWELFMGNLDEPSEQYHYFFSTYTQAVEAFKAGNDINPKYNAYILRHYFKQGCPTSATEYFPLVMPTYG